MSSLQTNSNKINVVFGAGTDLIRIHLRIDNSWSSYEQEGRAQNVLMFLNTTLEKEKCSIDQIDEIGVVMEGESFTATRIITVVANTIGYMKNIQVRSLPKEFATSDDPQKNKLWGETAPAEFVLPQYSGEPTITLKKPLNPQASNLNPQNI